MVTQVAEKYSDDTYGQVEFDGHVGHRDRVTCGPKDELLLGFEVVGRRVADDRDARDEVERLSGGSGAPAYEGVGPDDRPRVLVKMK